MEKLSVKKPFTILVAVILVIVLGVVSVMGMTADLLPNMSMPYLIIVTTYPGASPERVEADVVKPLESALGTVTGVKNVFSTSSENYGMVQLEFREGTNMDTTLIKVNSAIQEVSVSFPELCGTPSVIELSMDMMATMYVSVSRDGDDIFQLSDFVKNTVQPYIERQNGVASVSGIGLVQQSVHVELNKDKIDSINEKILQTINDKLGSAAEELENAQQQLAEGKTDLENAQSSFGATLSEGLFSQFEQTVISTAADLEKEVDGILQTVKAIRSEITDGTTGQALDKTIEELENISALLDKEDLEAADLLVIAGSLNVIVEQLGDLLGALNDELEKVDPDEIENPDVQSLRQSLSDLENGLTDLSDLLDSVPEILAGLKEAVGTLTQAQLDAAVGFATASMQLTAAQTQLDAAKLQYETAKEEALKSANLGQLLDAATLSQLIYAQNFSMPAGYIDDADDNSWLLRVGEEFGSLEELKNTLLVSMDGIGEVMLQDISDITLIDNAGQSYARLNNSESVILCIFKNSVTGTNETANNCLNAFTELEEKYEGTHIVTLMNQGSYINIIINSMVTSMVSGAALAIIILALFLKDVKPTIVVAVSIPLSVMFALVLMYFTGISLNMMTLSGLTLGIGMLVDNSIVVIENIYRLRGRGISAPRAAVQGTKQVAGAITSSTLTTVCVFLPLVFTTGMINELMLPLGLCIGYCLGASLLVALTVVPAAASTVLKNAKPKTHKWFEKIQDLYGKILSWCIDHKAIPLTASIALLGFTVYVVLNMGIVLIPPMTGNQIQVQVTTPETATREESYDMADDVIEMLLSIDGIDNVGVMDSSSTLSMMSGLSMGGGSYGSYVYYIVMPESTSASTIQRLTKAIENVTVNSPCKITASAGGLDDLTALLGSGLSINIYGNDIDTLKKLTDEVVQLVQMVEGYENIGTSFHDGDETIHLIIDKNEAMKHGLTVAQIYMEIANRLSTSSTSTSVTVNGVQLDVTVENNTDPLTVENLLDIEFETTKMNADGTSSKEMHKLSEFASIQKTTSVNSINRENQTRYVSVTASVAEGKNATLLARELSVLLDRYKSNTQIPYGYTINLEGESSTVNDMVQQMLLLILLGCVFIYLIMVAQFQSLLSPFIVLFTVPLAFTGGMLGLIIAGQQLSMLSMMGFALLMGTIVNNGIVFVDYTNQLRMGGMDRKAALIATGKTRMRPILMTALTTILAMVLLLFSDDMAGQLGSGMAIVVVGGLLYGTLMTLIIVPVMYDIFFKKQPKEVDIGSENLDDVPDDAAQFIAEELARIEAQEAEEAAIATNEVEETVTLESETANSSEAEES